MYSKQERVKYYSVGGWDLRVKLIQGWHFAFVEISNKYVNLILRKTVDEMETCWRDVISKTNTPIKKNYYGEGGVVRIEYRKEDVLGNGKKIGGTVEFCVFDKNNSCSLIFDDYDTLNKIANSIVDSYTVLKNEDINYPPKANSGEIYY